jgi:hypothetical protein
MRGTLLLACKEPPATAAEHLIDAALSESGCRRAELACYFINIFSYLGRLSVKLTSSGFHSVAFVALQRRGLAISFCRRSHLPASVLLARVIKSFL